MKSKGGVCAVKCDEIGEKKASNWIEGKRKTHQRNPTWQKISSNL